MDGPYLLGLLLLVIYLLAAPLMAVTTARAARRKAEELEAQPRDLKIRMAEREQRQTLLIGQQEARLHGPAVQPAAPGGRAGGFAEPDESRPLPVSPEPAWNAEPGWESERPYVLPSVRPDPTPRAIPRSGPVGRLAAAKLPPPVPERTSAGPAWESPATVGADAGSNVLDTGVGEAAIANRRLGAFTDAFTPYGRDSFVFKFGGDVARDMTVSIAWGLFALGLLVIGFARHSLPARYAGAGLLALTLLKLFLHDLAKIESSYRIGALIAVAFIALAASFLYQRSLRRTATTESAPADGEA